MTIKTRFAPSPTGHLHIGGARTALFAWLLARHHGGQFVLRVEDTDLERSTEAYTQSILEAMTWLGLAHDEGPVYQSQRMARYKAVLAQLEAQGKVYRCTCSQERLDQLREDQRSRGETPRYDGHCRDRAVGDGAPHVLRFKTPQSGAVRFNDVVRGEVVVSHAALDDLIVQRSDGSPTYNLTVVIDDADMGITHVIRGDDHLSNTPKQIHLYEAMGWNLPVFAHVPMILGPDGKRFSKRHGAQSVLAYRDEGYLPEALLNDLVRLGWSHGDQEIFSLDEMIQWFDLTHLSHAAARFDVEKLQWLNQHYLKAREPASLVADLQSQFARMGIETGHGPELAAVIALLQPRAKTLAEMASMASFWYREDLVFDEKAVAKHLTADQKPILMALQKALIALPEWTQEAIHEVVAGVVVSLGLKFPKVAQPLRVALTGSTVSPAIDATVHLLGRERTLQRLLNQQP